MAEITDNDPGWRTVGEAWEKVFGSVSRLGGEIAAAYKAAYSERASAHKAVKGGEQDGPYLETEPTSRTAALKEKIPTNVDDLTATLERSISAARQAFDESVESFSKTERTKGLGNEFEDALKSSLAQIGASFTTLSESIGADKARGAQK